MPLSTLESNLSDLNPTTSLVVFCQSGSRAQQAANLFTKGGFNQVHVFPEGMDYLSLHSKTRLEYPRIQHLWSIDRQFRFALGILIAVGLFGKVFVSEWFLIIPTIICAGLIFTSLINRCYFRSFIALLPWNQNNIAT